MVLGIKEAWILSRHPRSNGKDDDLGSGVVGEMRDELKERKREERRGQLAARDVRCSNTIGPASSRANQIRKKKGSTRRRE